MDIVRVQDAGLGGADDPSVLEWAARENRVLLTYDAATASRYAYDRVTAGLSMPGVFKIPASLALAPAIEELLLRSRRASNGEWECGSATSRSADDTELAASFRRD